MATTELKVEGMTCGHCAQTVTGALQKVGGVERAQVDLNAGRAHVEYDEAQTDVQEMIQAVSEKGYSAQPGS